MPVNPSELDFFSIIQKQMQANPSKPLVDMSLSEFRAGAAIFLQYAGPAANIAFVDTKTSLENNVKLKARIYHSDLDQNSPTLIFFPGCGYVLDNFESNAIACSRIAEYARCKVILVQFRLIPEHKLPQPMYDAYDAVKYIFDHANEFNVDTNNISIGGFSSGAHCTAVIANLSKQRQEFQAKQYIMLNGCYDISDAQHDYAEFENEDIFFTQEAKDYFFDYLYGLTYKQKLDPLYSPLFASDFSGFPKVTVITGEYDPCRSQSEAYYEKLNQQVAKVERIVLTGQTHNTLMMRDVMSDGEDPALTIANLL